MKKSYDALVLENSRLRMQIDKLSSELTRELSDNIDSLRYINEKKRRNDIIRNRVTNLISHNRRLENRYKDMAEYINDAIFIVNESARFIYVNQATAKLWGHHVDDIIDKTVFEVMPEEISDFYIREILTPVISSGSEVFKSETFFRGKISDIVQFTAKPVIDDNGSVIGVLNVIEDVSVQKSQEKINIIEREITNINTLTGDLQKIINDIFLKLFEIKQLDSGAIHILTEDGSAFELFLEHNIPAENLKKVQSFPRTSKEYQLAIQGTAVYDVMKSLSDEIHHALSKIKTKSTALIPLVSEGKVLGKLSLVSKFAGHFNDFTTRVFIESTASRIASVLSLMETRNQLSKNVEVLNKAITDLREKQQMLIQKSKMESLGELSAGMAHEINQPLLIISLAVENIYKRLDKKGVSLSKEYLETKFNSILTNVRRIQHVIDNLRIFSRDQTGILFDRICLNDAVRVTVNMVDHILEENKIQLVHVADIDPVYLLGNIFSLEQVFLNLFTNAIYAVNEKINLLKDQEYIKTITLRIEQSEGVVHVDFLDNGIGIPVENLDKLFNPFFTTKTASEGTGLGLSIAYGIIREMNGTIKIESKTGDYTKVMLCFPTIN